MASPYASSAPAAPELDFEALLSREYRPARVTRLIPREAYHPEQRHAEQRGGHHHHHHATTGTNAAAASSALSSSAAAAAAAAAKSQREEETARLVLSLVAQTKAFTRHTDDKTDNDDDNDATAANSRKASALALLTKPPHRAKGAKTAYNEIISPAFHEVELGDWESQINWEGTASPSAASNDGVRNSKPKPNSALSLLMKPRNPYLDHLNFDSCLTESDDPEALRRKAMNAPLILELGVAGQSVARRVYQNTVLSAQRPTPALKTDAYAARHERDWGKSGDAITSTADVRVQGALHADKDKMEALIESRQKKRAQMAKDKTNRVQEAMGTIAMGGGRGRTITSSLMGPGGTERTGRPSRHMAGGVVAHDTEYVEQLDMIVNHVLARDLSKMQLREFHRPKLPLTVVKPGLAWQFQIRYAPKNSKKAEGGTGGAAGASSSYQSMMMGSHPGAISKTKLRSEADLSPTEGKLILLEFSEESPPLQLSKGMASKIVNYYRGDKSRCPVSAGGGDRPARRKRAGNTEGDTVAKQNKQTERPPRLNDIDRETSVMDWIGKLPKKSQKERSEKEAIDVLPEGVTEILHPKGKPHLTADETKWF